MTETVSRAAAGLCAGNPLLVEQVAASLNRQEQADALVGVDTAVGAEGIVLTRFAGLPPAALRMAQAASVLGTRFHPVVAAELADLGERQAEAALEALCGSGLVRAETATTAGFVHPLLRQSLYHEVAAPVRARLHARAFTALCARGLAAEAVEHAIRADLVGDRTAITVLERVGRAALATGAPGTAAEQLRAAVRLAGDRASSTLQLALGDALLVGGRPGEAIDVYERVRAQDDLDPADQVHTLRMLGRALFHTAAEDQAVQRYRAAAAVAEACCGESTVAEVLLDDAAGSWYTLGPAYSLPLAARAYELTRSAARPLRLQTTGMWGLVAVLTGDPAGLVACDDAARELMTESAEPTEIWGYGSLGVIALAALYTERFADAEHALTIVSATADRIGSADAAAVHLTIEAALATRQGRLSDALASAHQSSAFSELMPCGNASAGAVKAEVLLLVGRLTECSDWCRRTEAIAAARGQSHAVLRLWHVRAQLLHHAGDHVGACALYAEIEQLITRMGIAEPCAVPWGRHAVLAYLASDRPDDSRRVIDWLERGAARLPCRWPRIAAATGRAALAEADGDLQAADQHYQAALALHEQVELPVEHIETLLGYGAFLRRRGQRTQVRPHLAQALVIAEKCEATWLADQACAELAIAGGRRRRVHDDPARLTAQEQRVARLAAAGYSNKAIAGQLFLSTKTIEYHLAQVYTKLGINSRRQLMIGRHDI